MKPNDDNGKLPSSERPYATGRLRKLPHEHYFDPAEEPFVVEVLLIEGKGTVARLEARASSDIDLGKVVTGRGGREAGANGAEKSGVADGDLGRRPVTVVEDHPVVSAERQRAVVAERYFNHGRKSESLAFFEKAIRLFEP